MVTEIFWEEYCVHLQGGRVIFEKKTRTATGNDMGVTPRNLIGDYRSFGGAGCIRLEVIGHLFSPTMDAAGSTDI